MVAEDLLRAASRRRPQSVSSTHRNQPSHEPTTSHSGGTADEPPLTLIDLVGIGVGGTLGSGLFLLAGIAAREVAGPAVSVSFLLAAIASLFSGLAYAEMSSRDPDCGGAYAFAYTSLGELPAFLVGSCLTLEYGVASAAIARSWASYLGETVRELPSWAVARDSTFSVLAFVLVACLTVVLSRGMEASKTLINTATLMYASVVIVIITVGFTKVTPSNWVPYFPFGAAGVLTGASRVFFSFVGFDEVATVAEEARNPARSVPLAMMISLALVALIYVLATVVLTGMIKYSAIDLDAPFSAAFRSVNLGLLAELVGLGTCTGMMNTTLVSMAAQPRIFVSMGRDGLLPAFIASRGDASDTSGSIDSATRITTIRCGAVIATFALLLPTELLADVVSGGTLLAFLATNLALMKVRTRANSDAPESETTFLAIGCLIAGILCRISVDFDVPQAPFVVAMILFSGVPLWYVLKLDMRPEAEPADGRPAFVCPFVPWFPAIGVITTTFLLAQLPAVSLFALKGWLLVSLAIYILYGRFHSVAGAMPVPTSDGLRGSATALGGGAEPPSYGGL